ncbi:DnaJ domain-containing protein [Methylococcaceae bacterium WWC4]|uniref:DnaJ C-terminal domain-containing protein n=1 Tax=Methylomonas sp. LWB TaxID=1905845 RepID=UPI0008DB197A|nr:DnaJ C-terminal domain-containing protein [Methylomonas sp. LWB]NJA04375.1 DnaJ domain-containing protein [Methylococcaceae bacterium WWC4]OHX35586.1 molecular chaperone DnaJ [Methylomonas sp. LWB]
MQYKDYYQILGVEREAALPEIKKAYRKLARKYHPDISKEPDAEARMKDVNEAYAVLSDTEKRAAYDQLGRGYRSGQEFHPPPNWDAGFEFSSGDAGDFGDFFSQLFGRMGAGRRGGPFEAQAGGFRAQGDDHHAKVLLDVEDAFRGASRQISLRVPTMDADGRAVLNNRTLNVKIPKGVYEGQIIRLAGQGAPGLGGGKAGDLLLEVHFNPHPRFRVDGSNLHMSLPVAPWEAALGGVVTINLFDSELKVRIPQGLQSGQQLRLRGKGIPCATPGDLLLDIQIVLPPANSDKAKQLYETMARELAFDPRASHRS